MKQSIQHPAIHAAVAAANVWEQLAASLATVGKDFRHWFSAGLGNPFVGEFDMGDDIAYVRNLADELLTTDRGLAEDLYAAADRAERANLAPHH
ncbi:hypothetical protein [Derxia lacustris]|uniref:hypothetical protein n=1 Tax=Derxia lacustris TaxID=764842 RepID=UPI000A16DB7B|nr:hypothetical protein [Derxia lacustris]